MAARKKGYGMWPWLWLDITVQFVLQAGHRDTEVEKAESILKVH